MRIDDLVQKWVEFVPDGTDLPYDATEALFGLLRVFATWSIDEDEQTLTIVLAYPNEKTTTKVIRWENGGWNDPIPLDVLLGRKLRVKQSKYGHFMIALRLKLEKYGWPGVSFEPAPKELGY